MQTYLHAHPFPFLRTLCVVYIYARCFGRFVLGTLSHLKYITPCIHSTYCYQRFNFFYVCTKIDTSRIWFIFAISSRFANALNMSKGIERLYNICTGLLCLSGMRYYVLQSKENYIKLSRIRRGLFTLYIYIRFKEVILFSYPFWCHWGPRPSVDVS